jgi:hypothetical protein
MLNPLYLNPEAESWLFYRLDEGPITINETFSLSSEHKMALQEMLNQYVTFFYLNRLLKLPADILTGTSTVEIGVPLMRYMVSNRWPYPHLLPKRSA